MMTDPRILECAKALLKPDFEWEQIGEEFRQRALAGASACILKWLEQGPSEAMLDEAQLAAEGEDARGVYRDMCAQAANEIGG